MKLTSLLLSTVLFTGCATRTAPDHDSGFAKVLGLDAFEGCYKNCSDTSGGSALACLSSIIWPDEFGQENRPEAVHIRQENSSRLVTSAILNGVVVRESTFEAGQDFYFREGRIELKRDYIASGAGQPGNVFIGMGTGKTILGLDAEGQGRVSQSVAFAGTGFLIIPIAGSATDIWTIRRDQELCIEAFEPASRKLTDN